jgi:hemerythrin-like domain-containing protein
MELLDEIRDEHRLIDRVAGSLVAWADRGPDHPEAERDLRAIVEFLRVFVIGHHHERQEEALFEALVEHAEIPPQSGPLVVLRREHDGLVAAVDAIVAAGAVAEAADRVRAVAVDLWQHLDKEDSVLLLEAERRLIDGGIRELAGRPADDRVEAARGAADDLVCRLPPVDHPDLVRGDGCVACDAFGVDCHGIETEWWSDWERLHHRSLDEG